MTDTLILGIDIGGTNFRMGIVDSTFAISNVKILPSSLITHTDDTVKTISCVINDYLSTLGDRKKNVQLIAAGWPSLVDKTRRILISSTNFPGIDGVDIVNELGKYISLPIIIDHDAYYILANDIHQHNVCTEGTILGFYFGTGMGNAIYIDGNEYIGTHGAASEIGHMPMGLGQKQCSCGNAGCVEMYCCGKAFEKLCSEAFPTTPISEVFVQHKDSPILNEFIRYMAIPVATEINILDPSYVFLGGGIIFMKNFPQKKLAEYIMNNVRRPLPFNGVKLIFSDNSPNNGMIGAAITGFKHLRDIPTHI